MGITTKRTYELGNVFRLGIMLFFMGLIGCAWWYFNAKVIALESFISDEAIISFELKTTAFPKDWMEGYDAEINTALDTATDHFFGMPFQSVEPWVGGRIGGALFEDGDWLLAAQYRNKKRMRQFIDGFLTEGETFEVQKLDLGTLYRPSFSSDMAFLTMGRWLIWSTDSSRLMSHLTDNNVLADDGSFIDFQKSFSSKRFFWLHVNNEKWLQQQAELLINPAQKPVLDALGKSMPLLGLAIKGDSKTLSAQLKFKTHEGVFDPEYRELKSTRIIPELLTLAPDNVLFFMNGHNLQEKYFHTKQFLSTLDPQFKVVFESLLQAQSNLLFGEDFDLEKDFIQKMNGQYGIVLDTVEDEIPFLALGLITGFGGADKEKSLSNLHSAVHYAQSQFVPQVEEVELPDGTIRKELVSVSPDEVAINKQELSGGGFYYTVDSTNSNRQFSYGMMNQQLVFATHPALLERMNQAKQNEINNLTLHKDFKDSVVYLLGPSETYGFLNPQKFEQVTQTLSLIESDSLWVQKLNSLKRTVRTATLARRVYPKETFWSFILFRR